jgi:nicotinamide mononucleotide transporter
MWFMARKRLEHWIFWIVGDIISIPLYLFKGLALTSIQYFIFTLIAIFGYIQWKQIYNSKKVIV